MKDAALHFRIFHFLCSIPVSFNEPVIMSRIPHVAENLIQHINLEVRASSFDKLKCSIDV